MKSWPSLPALTIAAVLGSMPESLAYDGDEMAKDAKLTMYEARTAASRERRGDVGDVRLEKRKGGSGLRYVFLTKEKGKVYQVGIDANTGAVLENRAQ